MRIHTTAHTTLSTSVFYMHRVPNDEAKSGCHTFPSRNSDVNSIAQKDLGMVWWHMLLNAQSAIPRIRAGHVWLVIGRHKNPIDEHPN